MPSTTSTSPPSGSPRPVRWRIGIDVGGTFTDLVALPSGSGQHDLSQAVVHKVPSTPSDPSLGVEQGLRHLLGHGVRAADVASVTHGTTIGLNAILQRRGARVVLVTSTGHRDLLQIGRARLPRSFDLHAGPPAAAVPREDVVEVDLRFTPAGTAVRPLDDAGYERLRSDLAALAPEAVAVSLVGGYAAVDTEQALADRLAEDLGVPTTAAGTVWPEAGEFERATLAVLDAQIRPLMGTYLTSLRDRLSGLGLTAPLFVSTSNGGSVSLASALARPIQTVLSGPAAGVAAAAQLWPDLDVVTIDMGGTSSDIGVLRGGRPVLTTAATIGDHPLTMPVVEVSAIGAGGGSVVWSDDSGSERALRVGPASVGAEPGPAAYGAGGTVPALTDAYVHSGVIDPADFLGGTMPLDAGASAAALATVAATHGTTPDLLVDGALRTATAGMASSVRTVLARHGEIPERFAFVAFGGAGGTHAALLAQAVGIRHVVVPAAAGTFCALGAAVTPVRRDFVRTLRSVVSRASTSDTSGSSGSSGAVSAAATELVREAADWLDAQDVGSGGEVLVTADVRYAGQPTTLTVELATRDRAAATAGPVTVTAQQVVEAFAAAHTRLHGFADADAAVQVEVVRVAVVGAQPALVRGSGRHRLRVRPGRRLRDGEVWVDATIVEPVVSELVGSGTAVTEHATSEPDGPGAPRGPEATGEHDLQSVLGPAVVEKTDTSVLVPAGWQVAVDGSGDLHLTRVDQRTETADALGA